MDNKIRICARVTEASDLTGCGYRECATALEAVMLELAEKPSDTAKAWEITAIDENMAVSAYRGNGDYEVHIYVGESDVWFTVED